MAPDPALLAAVRLWGRRSVGSPSLLGIAPGRSLSGSLGAARHSSAHGNAQPAGSCPYRVTVGGSLAALCPLPKDTKKAEILLISAFLRSFRTFDLCGRGDLNSHGSPHYHLKVACLPIPPHPRKQILLALLRKPWDISSARSRWSTSVPQNLGGATRLQSLLDLGRVVLRQPTMSNDQVDDHDDG